MWQNKWILYWIKFGSKKWKLEDMILLKVTFLVKKKKKKTNITCCKHTATTEYNTINAQCMLQFQSLSCSGQISAKSSEEKLWKWNSALVAKLFFLISRNKWALRMESVVNNKNTEKLQPFALSIWNHNSLHFYSVVLFYGGFSKLVQLCMITE